MKLGIFLRRHLLHLGDGVDHAADKQGGADIEGIDDSVRYYSGLSLVADSEESESKREYIAYEASSIAEEALDGISLGFLALIH